MMKKSLLAVGGALALGVVAGSAQAATTVSFNPGNGNLPADVRVFEDFDTLPAGTVIGTNAKTFSTASSSSAARPAFGSTGNYGAVLGTPTVGSYAVNFAATTAFSFVLGSLDTYNTLTLNYADGTSQAYNGGQIINGLSFPSGNQISGQSNGVVTYRVTAGPRITGAVFSSTSNSFEFDNLAVAVPEPATWGMMILGFGLVGGVLRRRRNVQVRYA